MNEAALLAARKDKTAVDMRDFDEAIDRLIAGLEKKRVMNARERQIVAYHESGHAIVASVLPGLDPVHKISIVQRGFGALGYTMQLPLEDRYLMTRTRSAASARRAPRRPDGRGNRPRRDFDRRPERPAARLRHRPRDGDRVGHERGDRRHQLRRARSATGSSRLGLPQERGAYAEDTAQQIDAEVKRIMTEAHDTARRILSEHRGSLEAVTRRLLEKEVMEGEELRRLLGMPPVSAEPPAPSACSFVIGLPLSILRAGCSVLERAGLAVPLYASEVRHSRSIVYHRQLDRHTPCPQSPVPPDAKRLRCRLDGLSQACWH